MQQKQKPIQIECAAAEQPLFERSITHIISAIIQEASTQNIKKLKTQISNSKIVKGSVLSSQNQKNLDEMNQFSPIISDQLTIQNRQYLHFKFQSYSFKIDQQGLSQMQKLMKTINQKNKQYNQDIQIANIFKKRIIDQQQFLKIVEVIFDYLKSKNHNFLKLCQKLNGCLNTYDRLGTKLFKQKQQIKFNQQQQLIDQFFQNDEEQGKGMIKVYYEASLIQIQNYQMVNSYPELAKDIWIRPKIKRIQQQFNQCFPKTNYLLSQYIHRQNGLLVMSHECIYPFSCNLQLYQSIPIHIYNNQNDKAHQDGNNCHSQMDSPVKQNIDIQDQFIQNEDFFTNYQSSQNMQDFKQLQADLISYLQQLSNNL